MNNLTPDVPVTAPVMRARMEHLEPRRLLSAGDLDPTFGSSGILRNPDLPPAIDIVTQRPGDRKTYLIVADDRGVERFFADGTLDTRFGSAGRVALSRGAPNWVVNSLVVQRDGKVLLGGNVLDAQSRQTSYFVKRLTVDGLSDSTFGPNHDGTVLANGITDHPDFTLADITARPDGKVVIAGTFGMASLVPLGPTVYTAVLQLTPDGSPDTSFGDAGTRILTEGSYEAGQLLLKRDGSLALAGLIPANGLRKPATATVGSEGGDANILASANIPFSSFVTGALTSTGTLALGISAFFPGLIQVSVDGGTTHIPFRFNTTLSIFGIGAVAATPDGKLLVANDGRDSFAVARLNADGSPDPTFGFGGTTAVKLNRFPGGPNIDTSVGGSLVTLPDGSIMLAGGLNRRLLLIRLQGGAHTLSGAGPAAIQVEQSSDVSIGATTGHSFAITFAGDFPIDTSHLDDFDLLVTGPNGYSARAKFNHDVPISQSPVTATYTFPAPGGTWTPADNGDYAIHLRSNQVFDTHGTPAKADVIDTFRLHLVYGDTRTFIPEIGRVRAGSSSRGRVVELPVLYDAISNNTLDPKSFGYDDLRVIGPGGITLHPRFNSATLQRNGKSWLASYTLDLPGGFLGGIGNYNVYTASTVLTAAGHPLDARFIASFAVTRSGIVE